MHIKNAHTWLLILGLAAIYPASSRAQFLKTLVNNAKNTIAGKTAANSNTGKKDSSAQANATDTAAAMQKLAQIIKSPGPTGPSISPADSAAAIRNFKTAASGSGQYYQYLDTYTWTNKKGRDSIFKDTMAIAISDAHYVRTAFSLLGMNTVILGRASMPHYSIMLHSETKTYSLHIIDTAAVNRSGWTYQVTKIGTERVGGYDCIHARVTLSKPGTKEPITEDIWNSSQVPGYAALKSLATTQNVTPQFMKALEQAGCDGFIVRMTMHGAAYSMEMLLTQSIRKDFSASEFEIPTGYTAESRVNPLSHLFQQ
jgi:hypothetical protein